jgi:hypothetical protein
MEAFATQQFERGVYRSGMCHRIINHEMKREVFGDGMCEDFVVAPTYPYVEFVPSQEYEADDFHFAT